MSTNRLTSAQLFSAIRPKGALALCLVLCVLGWSASTSAQKPRFVSFDAPGADLTPGDYNGTYPSSINVWGSMTGSYQGADTVFHGFLRSPAGSPPRSRLPARTPPQVLSMGPVPAASTTLARSWELR